MAIPIQSGSITSPVGHLHGGTHVDAPVYCIPSGTTADKIPLENLYGTGVIIDMRNKKKWEAITADDLEKATPKIEAGDFVVCNTGWQKWMNPEPFGRIYEYYHHYPGLVVSAAEWLINKKVKAIAGTWPTPDHSLTVLHLRSGCRGCIRIIRGKQRRNRRNPMMSSRASPCC